MAGNFTERACQFSRQKAILHMRPWRLTVFYENASVGG